MRVLVVGAGAVGSWLGGHLVAGGADVTLVARGAHGAALTAGGLVLQAGEVTSHVSPRVVPDLSAAGGQGPYDCGLVCVKSYHTAGLAGELAAAGPPPRLVSFQNGVGNEAVLAAALPGCQVLPATLTTGVAVGPPGTVQGGHRGGVGLPDADAAEDLARALAAGGLVVQRYRDPAAMKWSKLLLNCLGGATAALLGWPADRVFRDRRLFDLERAVWLEALAVMDALGLRPVGLPGYRVERYAALVRRLPAGLLYRLAAGRLAGARGGRMPGLAADLADGRTESEVEVLHGAVAAAGAARGVATPVCRTLAACLRDVAAGRRPRDAFADRPEALWRLATAGGA
jgi:2-dehydropantoate 2-reductase